MTNTGYELSLTIQVSLIIGGRVMSGYPIVYQGRNAFTFNGHSYPAITVLQLRGMNHDVFLARLADFKAYVESIEVGLTIDTTESYKLNTTSCPTA